MTNTISEGIEIITAIIVPLITISLIENFDFLSFGINQNMINDNKSQRDFIFGGTEFSLFGKL